MAGSSTLMVIPQICAERIMGSRYTERMGCILCFRGYFRHTVKYIARDGSIADTGGPCKECIDMSLQTVTVYDRHAERMAVVHNKRDDNMPHGVRLLFTGPMPPFTIPECIKMDIKVIKLLHPLCLDMCQRIVRVIPAGIVRGVVHNMPDP